MALEVGEYTFQLRPCLGHGSFGRVYHGRHRQSQQRVAGKCIITNDWTSPAALREARIHSGLQHENIVKVLEHKEIDTATEFVEEGSREYWIIMEFCDRGNLDQYTKKTRLTVADKISVMRQCASGVLFLHQRSPSVVHRDIKPSNILLSQVGGRLLAKLADFGLAKALDPHLPLATFSTCGGSLAFLPPEFHEAGSKLDEGSDCFSLGVVFFFFLQALDGQSITECIGEQWLGHELHQMADEAKQRWSPYGEGTPPGVPEAVTQLIAGMLRPGREDRVPMEEVKTELSRLTEPHTDSHKRPMHADEDVVQSTSNTVEEMTSEAGQSLHMRNIHPTYQADITLTLTHRKEDHASANPGFGANGEVVLTGILGDIRTLKYEFGVFRNLEFIKSKNFDHMPLVAVLESGKLVLSQNRYLAFLDPSSSDSSSLHRPCGTLLTALPNECFACLQSKDDQYVITIYDDDYESETVLRLPDGLAGWGGSTFIAGDKHEGRYVVTDQAQKSLDFFTNQGEHVRRKSLSYEPLAFAGITCTSEYILVAEHESQIIHVHDWQGDQMDILSREELKLTALQIHGLRLVHNGTGLVVAAGEDKRITHLLGYKVAYKKKPAGDQDATSASLPYDEYNPGLDNDYLSYDEYDPGWNNELLTDDE